MVLGHGPMAADAATAAVRVFREQIQRSLKEIVEAMHGAMRHTRGAALAIAKIDLEQQILQFVGVGNIPLQSIQAPETLAWFPITAQSGMNFAKCRNSATRGSVRVF
jgi:hypothetical protein